MKKALHSLNWIACFLHLLNLVVKHSVFEQPGVKTLIKKAKALIKNFVHRNRLIFSISNFCYYMSAVAIFTVYQFNLISDHYAITDQRLSWIL